MGRRREPLGRDLRDQGVPPRARRAGRGPCGEHRVRRRPRRDPVHGPLLGDEARGGGHVRGVVPRARPERLQRGGVGVVPGVPQYPDRRVRPQLARAARTAPDAVRRAGRPVHAAVRHRRGRGGPAADRAGRLGRRRDPHRPVHADHRREARDRRHRGAGRGSRGQRPPAPDRMTGTPGPLRIGTLGAARIAPAAIVKPAREVDEAELTAVAARDPAKAAKFAKKHDIPRVHETYEALLADDEIDAVYNPLPNGLHGVWTRRALDAGEHVLCEKPLTANADEAEEVAAAADKADLVVMEAFHYRYHPLFARMKEIVDSGELGPVRRLESWLCIPLPLFNDIRYRLDLAGGAVMDVGCYCIHQLRHLAGAEPVVTAARTRLRSPQVDRWMQADFEWPEGRTGQMTCALGSSTTSTARPGSSPVRRPRSEGQRSTSTTSGAWSEGSLPLRALRSTSAQVSFPASGLVTSTRSM